MAKPIPIDLNPSTRIEIDGALVARGLELAPAEFRQLMEDRKITVLCERGIGEDEGLYRASFYHEGKRVRLMLEAAVAFPTQPAGTSGPAPPIARRRQAHDPGRCAIRPAAG